MPMKLINSKSILDCDEIEEEVHNQENNEFIENLFDLPDYECAALFKRTDMNDADSEVTIKPCSYMTVLNGGICRCKKWSRYF